MLTALLVRKSLSTGSMVRQSRLLASTTRVFINLIFFITKETLASGSDKWAARNSGAASVIVQ